MLLNDVYRVGRPFLYRKRLSRKCAKFILPSVKLSRANILCNILSAAVADLWVGWVLYEILSRANTSITYYLLQWLTCGWGGYVRIITVGGL